MEVLLISTEKLKPNAILKLSIHLVESETKSQIIFFRLYSTTQILTTHAHSHSHSQSYEHTYVTLPLLISSKTEPTILEIDEVTIDVSLSMGTYKISLENLSRE